MGMGAWVQELGMTGIWVGFFGCGVFSQAHLKACLIVVYHFLRVTLSLTLVVGDKAVHSFVRCYVHSFEV